MKLVRLLGNRPFSFCVCLCVCHSALSVLGTSKDEMERWIMEAGETNGVVGGLAGDARAVRGLTAPPTIFEQNGRCT